MNHVQFRDVREPISALDSITSIRSCRVAYENYNAQGNVNSFKFAGGAVVLENSDIQCPSTDIKVDALDVDSRGKCSLT